MMSQFAAIVATILLAAIVGLQLLLAAGQPYGRAAWGGQHTVLPTKLRLGSLAAAGILSVSAWVILARSGLMAPFAENTVIRVATWVFAGFLCINTLGNLASKSAAERKVMAPATIVLALCFGFVALS